MHKDELSLDDILSLFSVIGMLLSIIMLVGIVAVIAAVLSGKGFTKTKTDFSDYGMVSDYAKTAVSSLAGEGVINGMGDGSFSPFAYATRAQAAVMINNMLKQEVAR